MLIEKISLNTSNGLYVQQVPEVDGETASRICENQPFSGPDFSKNHFITDQEKEWKPDNNKNHMIDIVLVFCFSLLLLSKCSLSQSPIFCRNGNIIYTWSFYGFNTWHSADACSIWPRASLEKSSMHLSVLPGVQCTKVAQIKKKLSITY